MVKPSLMQGFVNSLLFSKEWVLQPFFSVQYLFSCSSFYVFTFAVRLSLVLYVFDVVFIMPILK